MGLEQSLLLYSLNSILFKYSNNIRFFNKKRMLFDSLSTLFYKNRVLFFYYFRSVYRRKASPVSCDNHF